MLLRSHLQVTGDDCFRDGRDLGLTGTGAVAEDPVRLVQGDAVLGAQDSLGLLDENTAVEGPLQEWPRLEY
nr:hypothetical protein [Curtobacterium sp. ME26]